MSKFRYHALTISNTNGKTYWQNPHKTAEKAMSHALKYRRQDGYILLFKVNEKGSIHELQYIYENDSNNPNETWSSFTYLSKRVLFLQKKLDLIKQQLEEVT